MGRPVRIELVGLDGSEVLFQTESSVPLGRLDVDADLSGLSIRGQIQVVEAEELPYRALWLEPSEVSEHIREIFVPSEKRKNQRSSLSFSVLGQQDPELEGRTIDLSVSGLRAEFPKRYFPGDRLWLSIHSDRDSDPPLLVTVVVRWAAPSTQEGMVVCGLALEKSEAPDSGHRDYQEWVESLVETSDPTTS